MTPRTRRRRVWVTGLGMVTPVGSGVDDFWRGVSAGRSPVRRITRFDPAQFRSKVAAEIPDFDPLDYMDARLARQTDRFSQLAIASGRMAVADAGLKPSSNADARSIGVYVGSALGGIAYAEEQHEKFLGRGIRSVAPNLALAVFGGAGPANLAIVLGLHGPIVSNANSCASGAIAIGEAARAIRDGVVDAAVAGGVEAPLSPLAFGAFDVIRALSSRYNDAPESAARPFDEGRDGFVMGEGSALLVLEEAESARRRGARPYAEIEGYGATSDGYHMVQPRPDGSDAARAIEQALQDAAVRPAEIDYVNAHATSTPLGDLAESIALRTALGGRCETVPISGTKALYGHPLGASGAIEAALCSLAIIHHRTPAGVNLRAPSPDIAAHIPGLLCGPTEGPLRHVLSTSFGFGGFNAALVLGAVAGDQSRRPAAPFGSISGEGE